MKNKLRSLFGGASFLYEDPLLSAVSSLGISLLASFLASGNSLTFLLSGLSLWLLLLSIKLESHLLDYIFSTPLFVFNLGIFIRAGLGPSLLAFTGSGSEEFLSHWIINAPQSQLLWLIVQLFLVSLIYLKRDHIHNAAERLRLSRDSRIPRVNDNRFVLLFIILSAFVTLYIIASSVSGAFDRQEPVYLNWARSLWRLDTPIAFFSRLRDIWFYMVPASLLFLSRRLRLVTSLILFAFFSLAIMSGSRGLIFYPVTVLLIGFCSALQNLRSLRKYFIIVFLVIVTASPVIFVARDSAKFQQAQGIGERINAFVVTAYGNKEVFNRAKWLGRDLYACHDPFLFYEHNKHLIGVGTEGLGEIFYIFIPKHIYPQQPLIFTGHQQAKRLQGLDPLYRDGEWYPCLSFPGDLYRRWLWPGVIAGSLSLSLILGYLFLAWYKTFNLYSNTFHLLIAFYPITYIQSFGLATLTETLWAILWELPKYLVVMYLLGKLIDSIYPSTIND